MANPLTHAFQLQQTGYWCGPAATKVALSCRGVTRSQAELATELGTTTAGTDSSADVVRVLNDHLGAGTYGARYIAGSFATVSQLAALKADLVAAIDEGFGLVCNVAGTITALDGAQFSYPGGHYVAVVGYRAGGDEAFVADIAAREYWTTTARLGTWIATRGYSHPLLAVAPSQPTRKVPGMFRLIDPDGGQHVISPDTLSPTGWSYEEIVKPDSALGWMVVAGGITTANGNPKDSNHDPHANNEWRPGTFGPSKAEVREQLLDDLAAKVVAALPAGGSGILTAAQVAVAVRAELDKTRFAS